MPPRLFRPKTLLTAFLAISSCLAQERVSTVVFSSADKHVVLPRGLMVTLKTVAAPASVATSAKALPAGVLLQTTLDQKINGKDCRIGDSVHLTLVYPVRFERDGQSMRIPERAAIAGHIVLIESRGHNRDKSRLAFVTDSISWEGGTAPLLGVAVTAKEGAPQTAQTRNEPDLMRPAQDSVGNTHAGRSRGVDSSGGPPAPGNAHDMGR